MLIDETSMDYQGMKEGIRRRLEGAAEDFFMAGYFLRQVSENALFVEDGYKNIWDFAKGEYGLSASSASRFMAINARFSVDGGRRMAERYAGMGVSKLQEMLRLPDGELEKVTQETTVREIRAMKKRLDEPKSFFGLPKTEREKHPYTYTPGCGDGKYTCFSCARPCGIRQEERYCRDAPMGSPFPCTQMGEEKRLEMETSGILGRECQHLHQELAAVRAGDKEPAPCCQDCGYETCYSRCDVARKRDGGGRGRAKAEGERQRREAEAERPEPSSHDIKAFCKWVGIKSTDSITADSLKKQYRHAGGGGSAELRNYSGRAMGIQINYKREITWVQLARRIKEIQEAGKKEEGRLLGFYKDIYPGTRQVISRRNREAIMDELKGLYGSTYENGEGWSAYPDKIVFRDSPGAEQVQVTWGRFTARLVNFLDRFPEVESSALEGDGTGQKKQDIIDADFQEVKEEVGAIPAAQEPDADAEAFFQEEDAGAITQEPEAAADPEGYTKLDVDLLLDKYSRDLADYRKYFADDEYPPPLLKRQRILVDALTLLRRNYVEIGLDQASGDSGTGYAAAGLRKGG